jgi:hypothetical protein
MITRNDLADLMERLKPYLDWSEDSTRLELADRLVNVARIVNDFAKEVLDENKA